MIYLSLPQIDWLRYFSTVLSEVPFDSSERVVSYSMPYFIDLGPLLETTEKRYSGIRRLGHCFLDKCIWCLWPWHAFEIRLLKVLANM